MAWKTATAASPLLVSTGITAWLCIYLWKRRATVGARALSMLMFSTACWAFGVFLQVITPEFALNYALVKTTYFAIMAVPVCWLLFCAECGGYAHRLTGRALVLLALPGFVCALLSAANWNSIFRHHEHMVAVGALHVLENGRGSAWYFAAFYAYALVIAGDVLLVRRALHSRGLYRAQMFAALGAGLLPWLSNLLFLLRLSPLGDLDPAPFAFTLTGILITGALFRFRLLELVPIARYVVFENMPDCVMVLDSRNHIVDMNPASRACFGHQAQIGTRFAQAFSEWPQLVSGVESGTPHGQLLITKTWWDLTSTPLRNHSGNSLGRVVVLRDVTELKTAELQMTAAIKEAEEAARIKAEFLATVSHELRTPLNGVIGMCELLLDTGLTMEQLEFSNSIRSSAEKLMQLIGDVLDISTLEAGRREIRSETFDLRAMLADVACAHRPAARQKGLDLVFDFPEQPPLILHGAAQSLRQVLFNLVSNAVKFTSQGQVEIRLQPLGVHHHSVPMFRFRIHVTDTGIGISPEARKRLFTPFMQEDSSARRRYGGTGLGLAISSRLVELMGGRIGVESSPGSGTRFWVELEVPESPTAAGLAPGDSIHGASMRIE